MQLIHFRQLRGWLMQLFSFFNRKRGEREFAEELESHLAMHIEDNLRAGMSPEEARRVALIKLGGLTLTKELRREQGGLPMLETLGQDLRFGLRMLRKHPGFSLIAALTLALGIGANLTIFSFVDTFFLRPIPAREPNQLATVEGTHNGRPYAYFAYPAYEHYRDHNKSFEALAAHYSTAPLNMVIEGDARVTNGAVVSAN